MLIVGVKAHQVLSVLGPDTPVGDSQSSDSWSIPFLSAAPLLDEIQLVLDFLRRQDFIVRKDGVEGKYVSSVHYDHIPGFQWSFRYWMSITLLMTWDGGVDIRGNMDTKVGASGKGEESEEES